MSRISQYKERLEKFLNEENAFTKVLATIEEKTKVKRLNIFLGVVVLFSLYLIFGYGCALIVNALGAIYPAYCSVKAVESEAKDDDTQWLIYWIVYSVFTVVEYFSDFLFSWFPFYFLFKYGSSIGKTKVTSGVNPTYVYPATLKRVVRSLLPHHVEEYNDPSGLKLIFLGWCMAPISSNGANVIYHKVIKPFVIKHQQEIDEALEEATAEATKVAGKAMETAQKEGMKQYFKQQQQQEQTDGPEEDKKDM